MSCYASVLTDNLQRGQPEAARETADKLCSATDELNDSFNRILALVNIESGMQEPHVMAFDLGELLRSLQTQFAPQARRKGLRLRIAAPRHDRTHVSSDPAILLQILGNLIDNAIKYTKSGWVLVGVTGAADGCLSVEVRDTGCGIPPEQAAELFSGFGLPRRRLTDRQLHGLGIGLAFAGKAVARLKGHALTLSGAARRRGSCFRLNLPQATALPESSQTASEPTKLNGLKVLIVDDEPDVLQSLTEQLRHWDCEVWSVPGIAELKRLFEEVLIPPDLLICDYRLANGHTASDLLPLLEAEYCRLPTLILSAHGIPESEKQRWSGPLSILRKPASAAKLQQTLWALMTEASAGETDGQEQCTSPAQA